MYSATLSGSRIVTPVISTALLCGNTLCNTSSVEFSRPVRIELERLPVNKDEDESEELDEERRLCSYWTLDT